jgi:hypothetical protein
VRAVVTDGAIAAAITMASKTRISDLRERTSVLSQSARTKLEFPLRQTLDGRDPSRGLLTKRDRLPVSRVPHDV